MFWINLLSSYYWYLKIIIDFWWNHYFWGFVWNFIFDLRSFWSLRIHRRPLRWWRSARRCRRRICRKFEQFWMSQFQIIFYQIWLNFEINNLCYFLSHVHLVILEEPSFDPCYPIRAVKGKTWCQFHQHFTVDDIEQHVYNPP
jgi:hypothetical protein